MKKKNEVVSKLGWSGAEPRDGVSDGSTGSLSFFYEWPHWEGIMHSFLLGLILYAMYRFATQASERTLGNVLLFTIVVGLDAQLHHMINARSGRGTTYGL